MYSPHPNVLTTPKCTHHIQMYSPHPNVLTTPKCTHHTEMYSPHPNVLTTLNTLLAWPVCLNIVRPSLVSQLALHLHGLRRTFCTHYLFPLHTAYPAHHMLLCFINIAVFGGRQTYEAHYMLVTCSLLLLGRSQVLLIFCQSNGGIVDLSPGRCLNVCLRLLCLCCAVWVQALCRANTLSKRSYHMLMHKMCKPAKAALLCRVIRIDSWYRHCHSQVAVRRRKIRRTSNSVKSVHGQLYMEPN